MLIVLKISSQIVGKFNFLKRCNGRIKGVKLGLKIFKLNFHDWILQNFPHACKKLAISSFLFFLILLILYAERSFIKLCESTDCLFLVIQGKSIRMMGVSESEVDEVLQNAKADLRIAGFEEEEKRLRQRISDRPHASLKLPQGRYIFHDFRTLEIPGVEVC